MDVIDKDLKEYHDEFKTRLDSRVGDIYGLKKQIEELTKKFNDEVYQYRKELDVFEVMGNKLAIFSDENHLAQAMYIGDSVKIVGVEELGTFEIKKVVNVRPNMYELENNDGVFLESQLIRVE